MPKPDWKKDYQHKLQEPKAALNHIKPGNRIFIGTGCAVPSLLVKTLEDNRQQAERHGDYAHTDGWGYSLHQRAVL